MRFVPMLSWSWVVVAGTAAADPGVRRVGASARTLGCSSWVAGSCEGVAPTYRSGANVTDLVLGGREDSGAVINVQAAARPDGGQVASQLMVGAGWRLRSGRWWLQGGPAIAVSDVGARTIRTRQLFGTETSLSLFGGIGMTVELWNDHEIDLALDVARCVDDSGMFQVTTSLAAHRF